MLAFTNAAQVLSAGALGQRATTTTSDAPTELFPRTPSWLLTAIVVLVVVATVVMAMVKLHERGARRRVMSWDEKERISRQWELLQKLYDLTGGQPRYKVKTRK
jgi:hypothetical protein